MSSLLDEDALRRMDGCLGTHPIEPLSRFSKLAIKEIRRLRAERALFQSERDEWERRAKENLEELVALRADAARRTGGGTTASTASSS